MNNAAILIACQYYKDDSLCDLIGVNHDVEMMKDVLLNYCGCEEKNVFTFINDDPERCAPTGSEIISGISKIADNFADVEINNLFIYYSGHGFTQARELHLLPSDTVLNASFGTIPTRVLKTIVAKFKRATNIIVFFDVCQQEFTPKGNHGINSSYFPGGAAVFYSCFPQQSSYMLPATAGEGSLFTKCLVEILCPESGCYTVKEVSVALKKKLNAYCTQFGILQKPYTKLEDDSLGNGVIVIPPVLQQTTSNTVAKSSYSQPLALQKSIWLTDAEQAEGEQTRFNTFTHTAKVDSFIDPQSGVWGIASVKGIGKTFLLQVKRMKLSKKAYCFPNVKPNKNNNWATECVKFNENIFQKGESYFEIKLFWKYSLVCYILHCWLEMQRKRKNCGEFIHISQWLKDEYEKGTFPNLSYQFLTDSSYATLQQIFKTIVKAPIWVSQIDIDSEYNALERLGNKVLEAIAETNKKELILFLDKIDQAMRQPSSELSLDCEFCSKSELITTCNHEKRDTDYCSGAGVETCPQRDLCCYGCEKFADNFAGTQLRVKEGNSVRNSHCNYWQRLQLALVEAVEEIKTDFRGQIKVIYTVRLEAFNYAEDVWSTQRAKINALTCPLHYTRDEQEKIYRECIAHQNSFLLYSPELADRPGHEDYAFVGVNKICHPYVSNEAESIFDIIYRHSFDRTRDIQDYGQALTAKMEKIKKCSTEEERGVIVKETIEETAARLAYNTNKANRTSENSYYFEKAPNMPSYWADPVNFERLLNAIDRNLLFIDDMQSICRRINSIHGCPIEGCELCTHHPFSVLKNLGMLGHIVVSENKLEYAKQQFLSSKDVTYFHDEDSLRINKNTMYLIHPALTKSIEKLKNDNKIMHFCGFLIGKELSVKQELLRSIFRDKQELPSNEFVAKYYRQS